MTWILSLLSFAWRGSPWSKVDHSQAHSVSQWRVPGLAGTLHKHWSFLRKNLWPSLRHRQGYPSSCSVCLFFPYPSSIIQFTLGCSWTLIHLRESLNEYSHVYLVMWSFGYKTCFCSRSTNRRMTTASCPVKNTGVGSKMRLGGYQTGWGGPSQSRVRGNTYTFYKRCSLVIWKCMREYSWNYWTGKLKLTKNFASSCYLIVRVIRADWLTAMPPGQLRSWAARCLAHQVHTLPCHANDSGLDIGALNHGRHWKEKYSLKYQVEDNMP